MKAVYRVNNKPDIMTLILVVAENGTFTEEVIEYPRSEGRNEYFRFIREGYLERHRVCGGRFTKKYEQEERQALAGLADVYIQGGTWIAPVEIWDSLPRVVRINGGSKEFHPSIMGKKETRVLGGVLSPADYVHGSRSRD